MRRAASNRSKPKFWRRSIQASFLTLHVTRPDGTPATFTPWFGALAHAIFFQVGSLSYFHTHVCSAQTSGCTSILGGTRVTGTQTRPGVLRIGTKTPARYAVSSGYLRVDPEGAVEILVEQALPESEVDAEVAREDLKAAETELAKWGDKPHDGDYTNLVARIGWARARIDIVAH